MHEPARRAFHTITGTILAALIYHEIISIAVIAALIALAIALSLICKTRRLPIIHPCLEAMERKENLPTHPGIGVITFLTGTALAMSLYTKTTATAAVLILTWADGAAGLLGHYGRIRYSANKTWEGILIGSLAGTLAAATLVQFFPALIASTITMHIEGLDPHIGKRKIDDNLFIPVIAGAILWLAEASF